MKYILLIFMIFRIVGFANAQEINPGGDHHCHDHDRDHYHDVRARGSHTYHVARSRVRGTGRM